MHKTKLTDIMDTQAFEVYLGNQWAGFLPMITLWHIFQSLARTITLAELNLLISPDGVAVDCGKAGKWVPWKYVVLSPEFLRRLRLFGDLKAMEVQGILDDYRRGCYEVVNRQVFFIPGVPYYRKVPKGYQPEVVDGERVFDAKLEADCSVVNTGSEIGRYIIETGEWPMTHSLAAFRRFTPRPVRQDRPEHAKHQGPKPFWINPVHQSDALLQVGVASSLEALRELEMGAFAR